MTATAYVALIPENNFTRPSLPQSAWNENCKNLNRVLLTSHTDTALAGTIQLRMDL